MKMKTLWSDMDKTRQFLIDDALQLPPGDFVLRTPTGKKRLVDPDAIKAYEVSKEEAKAWLKEQFGQVSRQFGVGLRDHFLPPRQKADEKETEESSANEKKSSDTPGLDLLADITNTPRDTLKGDYNAVGRSLRSYLGDVISTVTDGVSGDPQREKSARDRMHDWSKVLKEHGIAVANTDRQKTATEQSSDNSKTTDNADADSDSPSKKSNKKTKQ